MIHISIAFCSSPGALGFRPDTRRSAPGWPSRGRFCLCKDLFETRDLGFRHASDSAEFHGANLIHLDRITQCFVGNADLLGGGGHAVAGTVAPPLLHDRVRFAHENLRRWESGTLGTSADNDTEIHGVKAHLAQLQDNLLWRGHTAARKGNIRCVSHCFFPGSAGAEPRSSAAYRSSTATS